MLDTMDKIMEVYMACIATEPFVYKTKLYEPRPLRVTPNLLRGFICNPNCGGCCSNFTLDYLPDAFIDTCGINETRAPRREHFEERMINVSGKVYTVISDTNQISIDTEEEAEKRLQYRNNSCKYLDMENGRCKIHSFVSGDDTGQPFSCDFELLRFTIMGAITFTALPRLIELKDVTEVTTPSGTGTSNLMSTRLYGRGWQMSTLAGTIGATCELTPPDAESIKDVIRKLKRLALWADYFEIKHCVNEIIKWAENPLARSKPLYLNQAAGTGHHQMKPYTVEHLLPMCKFVTQEELDKMSSKARAIHLHQPTYETPHKPCLCCKGIVRKTSTGMCAVCTPKTYDVKPNAKPVRESKLTELFGI